MHIHKVHIWFCSVVLHCTYKDIKTGTNPTIVSYNASAVKTCNTTNSLVCFENKNIAFNLKTLYPTNNNAGVVGM
jgi:hypothetical protein